ncbi:MAG: E3 binding domain-containing protein, partial [Pseudomonadales bacterium]
MPTPIYLVKVGMNMTEGVVEEWYIPDGGAVTQGQLLYRLETEKVNLDVDAELDGIVRHVVAEGITMKPGDIVGYIYAANEAMPADVASSGASATSAAADSPASPAAQASPAPAPVAAEATRGEGGRLLSSPAARRLAGELGVSLDEVTGTGPGGRIVEADVQAAAAAVEERGGPSSPIARKLARELDIDLGSVRGTGPGGRITKEDVERAAADRTSAPMPAAAPAAAPPPRPQSG